MFGQSRQCHVRSYELTTEADLHPAAVYHKPSSCPRASFCSEIFVPGAEAARVRRSARMTVPASSRGYRCQHPDGKERGTLENCPRAAMASRQEKPGACSAAPSGTNSTGWNLLGQYVYTALEQVSGLQANT